jgi:hypothetical protein
MHRQWVRGVCWGCWATASAHAVIPADQSSPMLPSSNCRRGLQPLVDAGFVEIVYGGGPVGKYLCSHPSIASGACLEMGATAGAAQLGRWALDTPLCTRCVAPHACLQCT